jgi:chitinase
MKSLKILIVIFISLFSLMGCNKTQTVENINLKIDIDTQKISYENDLFDATFEHNENYIVSISVNDSNEFASDVKLYINDLLIDSNLYVKTQETITYTFSNINDINPNALVEVEATFNLNGGILAKSDFEEVNPDQTLTITSKNAGLGGSLTIMDSDRYALRYFHKIFIKYQEIYDAYEVIDIDPATKSVDAMDMDDYDYIIALEQYYDDETVLDIISSYTTGDKQLKFVIFDQPLSTYEQGDLEVYFYTLDIVSDSFNKTLLSPETLPTPIKENYNFIGWYNGEEEVLEYLGYQKIDDVDSITYEARWETYTMTELYRYLNELIPDEIYENIVLPTVYSGFDLTWTSSHPNIITNEGDFIRPYQQETVTLNVEITSIDGNENRSFDVVAIGYKSLDKPIASSYIYREYDKVDDAFFDTLDIINTAFILGNDQGDLYGTSYLSQVSTHIMPEAKKRGNWVIMSVGPSTSWSTIAASATLREHFANEIVRYINDYGFDGVDIDWETPTTAESQRFTALMKVVYEKVKENNPNHLVTTAITGGQWQPPKYDLINSNQYLDYINLMTYGLTSGSGQYQNPLYRSTTYHNLEALAGRTLSTASIDESVKILKNTFNIDYDKIIVGVAFYGMKQTRTYNEDTNSYSTWTQAGSVYYHEIYRVYLDHPDYQEYYDQVADVPYLLNDDHTVFISYDNPRSILRKSTYIIDNELGGMMFWEYGTDTSGVLLQALRTGLLK